MGKYISFGSAFLAGFIAALILGGISSVYLYSKTSELQGSLSSALRSIPGAGSIKISGAEVTIGLMFLEGYYWVLQSSFTSISASGSVIGSLGPIASAFPDPLFYYLFVALSAFASGALFFGRRGTRILTALLAPLLPALLIVIVTVVVSFLISSFLGPMLSSLPVNASAFIPKTAPLDFILVFGMAYVFLLLGFEGAAGLRGLISMASKQEQPFKTAAVNVPGTATTQVQQQPATGTPLAPLPIPPVIPLREKPGEAQPAEEEAAETEEQPAEEAAEEQQPEEAGEEEEQQPAEEEATAEVEQEGGEAGGKTEGEEEPEEEEPEVIVKVRVPKRRAKPAARKLVKKPAKKGKR
ncbi:hypothetical protein HYS54_02840 [Candidatus Micrarchaeota archaeon]|nr:hypothetical protein [Candidatus Micrarchaeota archaeon]